MIRFISFLLGKHYESCKGCEVLKEQLDLANAEKKEMLDTILNLVKPQGIPQIDVPVKVVNPAVATWRTRQRELENSSKNQARIREQMKADATKLEKELGLDEEVEGEKNVNQG